MYYWVRFTADRITDESASNGEAAESGWIDPVFSMRVIFEYKNDGRAYRFDTRDEAVEFIQDTIGDCETDDDVTFYATDSQTDPETGDVWAYAAHIETT